MSEYTKGPWFADGVVVVDHEGGSLGEMTPGFPGMAIDEMEANTRLAAAAPDMLEALQAADEYLARVEGQGEGGTTAFDVPRQMVRAAIEKATENTGE